MIDIHVCEVIHTENIWCRALVRPLNAIGDFYSRDFHFEIEVTGDYHKVRSTAISEINVRDFEVLHIVSLSKSKSTL